MKIIEYNETRDIKIQFLDKYQYTINTTWQNFERGGVNNPYYATVYNIGIKGSKYPAKVEGIMTKEYDAWHNMLKRCYDNKWKEKHPCYENVICCEEWLLYENFYEWLHNQENFDRWLNGDRWALDKDILVKGNKIYSPKTCCLVPNNINQMFVKTDKKINDLPIGVSRFKDKFDAYCKNPLIRNGHNKYIGRFSTPEKASLAYKLYKENLIKEVAKIEFNKGNITKGCYDAMINYEVEIID